MSDFHRSHTLPENSSTIRNRTSSAYWNSRCLGFIPQVRLNFFSCNMMVKPLIDIICKSLFNFNYLITNNNNNNNNNNNTEKLLYESEGVVYIFGSYDHFVAVVAYIRFFFSWYFFFMRQPTTSFSSFLLFFILPSWCAVRPNRPHLGLRDPIWGDDCSHNPLIRRSPTAEGFRGFLQP